MDNGNDVLMEDLLSKIAEENREQFIEDLFESGATRKQLYGIPDSLMNGFYACAYEYYQKGEIEKAEHFFKFLMMYDFYNPDYAFGLAAVYQLKQDYKHALDIYAIAYALDDDNLRAIFEGSAICTCITIRKHATHLERSWLTKRILSWSSVPKYILRR